MFAGSIVLLLLAFSRAGGRERLPDWLTVGLQVCGFAMIAIGFYLAMRMRSEIREKRAAEEKKRA